MKNKDDLETETSDTKNPLPHDPHFKIITNIMDDGNGNLYDSELSSSFAQFAAGNFEDVVKSTGSFAGNVFYEQGIFFLRLRYRQILIYGRFLIQIHD